MVFYTLSDEDWEYFANDGWIAIPVWGGFAFTKIGYKPILIDHESPKVRAIEEIELDRLVSKLQNYGVGA